MTQDTPQSTQHAKGHHIAQAQGPGAIANVITNIFRGGRAEQRALRNRQAMLQLVRNTWIKGVLEQSLHGAAMIELGLEERADAVERPWDMVLQTPDHPNRTLPPGTKIVNVFDETSQTLLILGEPGSGKTTMLLDLARDTIARAEQDPMQPIPVVFNLSSWAEKQQPIAEWLVEELNTKYNIPKKIARPWVENDDLLLLLDGLDEVKAEHRDDCVKAINGFRQEHGLTPLVVCSRIADYEALSAKLKLQGAVLLQPLTPRQVDSYLDAANTVLAAVRETLQHDTVLQELAQTPLMLSVMALAYQGASAKDLQSLNTTEARRKHLFHTFVRQMLERRGGHKRYSPERTVHWLAWLARRMSKHYQTVFSIDRIRLCWLRTDAQRLLYAIIVGLTVGLISGPSFGPVAGLIAGLISGLTSISVEALEWSWSWRDFVGRLVLGLMGGLSLGLIDGLIGGLLFGLSSVMILVSWLIGEPFLAIEEKVGLTAGLIAGSIAGLNVGVWRGLTVWWTVGLISGIVIGLCLELPSVLGYHIFMLFRFLFAGLARSHGVEMEEGSPLLIAEKLEREKRRGGSPSIHRSKRNTVVFGLIGSLIGGLVGGLRFALIGGFIGGLVLGGLALIQHYTLRFVLHLQGNIPWNLARFLDYATNRIFLRKVGGGYIFIHRMLQEYFASLAETKEVTQ